MYVCRASCIYGYVLSIIIDRIVLLWKMILQERPVRTFGLETSSFGGNSFKITQLCQNNKWKTALSSVLVKFGPMTTHLVLYHHKPPWRIVEPSWIKIDSGSKLALLKLEPQVYWCCIVVWVQSPEYVNLYKSWVCLQYMVVWHCNLCFSLCIWDYYHVLKES